MSAKPQRKRLKTRVGDVARKVGPPMLQRAGRRLGYSVVKNGPVSPIPEIPPPNDPSWTRRSDFAGISFDQDEQIRFIADHLIPYIREFDEGVRGKGFELWNELFQAGDAEILYALIRHLKPSQVLEIGSGNSTLVSAAASISNSHEGAETHLFAIDPDPRVDLSREIEGLDGHERVDCRNLPLDRFEELRAGDVLFIDTEHIVKRGSEVNWLLLEVMPRLASGVWVHFHDIFLPYDYPYYPFNWLWFLNEQYLLHAFLIGSDWTIELGLASLFYDRHDQLLELIPSLKEEVPGWPDLRTWLPSSMWMRRRDPAGANGPAAR